MTLQVAFSSGLIFISIFLISSGNAKLAQKILDEDVPNVPSNFYWDFHDVVNSRQADIHYVVQGAIKNVSYAMVAGSSTYMVVGVIFLTILDEVRMPIVTGEADFIIPCNDTSRECLLKAAQYAIPLFTRGMPDLGVPTLDPFVMEKVSIPLPGLSWNLYNGKLSGLRNCIINDIAMDLEKMKAILNLRCNVTIKGTYDAKGQFLLFTIDGAGDAKIKITNFKMNMNMNMKFIKASNNLHHYAIKKYNYSIKYGDNVSFKIQNLFKKSKELSDVVLQFMNDNWKDVVEEFGKPLVDYIVEIIVRNVEKFLLKVPFEELINVPVPQ